MAAPTEFPCYLNVLNNNKKWDAISSPMDQCHIKFQLPHIIIQDIKRNIRINSPNPSFEYQQTHKDTFGIHSNSNIYAIQIANEQDIAKCQVLLQYFKSEVKHQISLQTTQGRSRNENNYPGLAQHPGLAQQPVPMQNNFMQSQAAAYNYNTSKQYSRNDFVNTQNDQGFSYQPNQQHSYHQQQQQQQQQQQEKKYFKQHSYGDNVLASPNKLNSTATSYSDINDDSFASNVDIQEAFEPTEEELLCDNLCEIIETGNIAEAQKVVKLLAEKKSKLTMYMLSKENQPDKTISIIIRVSSLQFEDFTLTMDVEPHKTTIKMLKYRIAKQHGIMVTSQRWIINRRLAQDHETLVQHKIKSDNDVVYLYLASLSVQDDDEYTEATQVQQDTRPKNNDQTVLQRDKAERVELQADVPDLIDNRLLSNQRKQQQQQAFWECPLCTFKNLPTMPSCDACLNDRPADYKVPAGYILTPVELVRVEREKQEVELTRKYNDELKKQEAEEANQNFFLMQQLYELKLIPNLEMFECPVCFTMVEKGDGVMLRECLHNACRLCLTEYINTFEDAEVRCPLNDGFSCPAVITQQEIQELLTDDDYGKYLEKSIRLAESTAKTFHCRTIGCRGFCFLEDEINEFPCPICHKVSCLTCRAIHENVTCKQYQDDLKAKAQNNVDYQKTQDMIKRMVEKGEAMNCPQCDIILQKKSGCDWMRCTMCKTEICWATKGPRWGPAGNGDTSGGCKCAIGGQRCTPTCGNCH